MTKSKQVRAGADSEALKKEYPNILQIDSNKASEILKGRWQDYSNPCWNYQRWESIEKQSLVSPDELLLFPLPEDNFIARLLPPLPSEKENVIGRPIFKHRLSTLHYSETYPCLRSFGEACSICGVLADYAEYPFIDPGQYTTGDFYVNILPISLRFPKLAHIMKAPLSFYNELLGWFTNLEVGDVTDVEVGADIILTRFIKGYYDGCYFRAYIPRRSSPVSVDPEETERILNSRFDLSLIFKDPRRGRPDYTCGMSRSTEWLRKNIEARIDRYKNGWLEGGKADGKE